MEKFTKVLVAVSQRMEDVNTNPSTDNQHNWVIEAKLPKSGINLSQLRDLYEIVWMNSISATVNREGIRILGKE